MVAVDQMAQFVSDDIFYARCMVNIYLKEEKYFKENGVRRRKTFIFANCMIQSMGKTIDILVWFIRIWFSDFYNYLPLLTSMKLIVERRKCGDGIGDYRL